MTVHELGNSLIIMPMLVATAVYCWRYGMRWHGDVWIQGRAAKLTAVILLALGVAFVLARQ